MLFLRKFSILPILAYTDNLLKRGNNFISEDTTQSSGLCGQFYTCGIYSLRNICIIYTVRILKSLQKNKFPSQYEVSGVLNKLR